MFCRKCGNEVEEEWKVCPNCGEVLASKKSAENLSVETGKKNYEKKSRADIKEELTKEIFSEKGGVVLGYGTGAISKDMARILQTNEEMLRFFYAFRTSIIGHIKSLRMFRDYAVCTNQRIVYIEVGNRAFSLLPFLRKTISIKYDEIQNIVVGKRVGIFSGKIVLECNNTTVNLAVTSAKEAEEIKAFLIDRKR